MNTFKFPLFSTPQISLALVVSGLTAGLIWLIRTKLIRSKKVAYEDSRSNFEQELVLSRAEIKEAIMQDIAREIHDHVTLSLTLAKLHLSTSKVEEQEQTAYKIQQATDMVTDAIDRLRDISHSLNSDAIASHGLITALENEIERIHKTNIFQIELSVLGNPIFLSNEQELIIFRVIQECLNNMIKHSKTRFAQISLTYLSENLHLVVMDYGVGFKIAGNETGRIRKEAGSGLGNIQARVSAIKGHVKIESVENDGTIYTITIPYSPKNLEL
jgi:signal transduction histidine kinase